MSSNINTVIKYDDFINKFVDFISEKCQNIYNVDNANDEELSVVSDLTKSTTLLSNSKYYNAVAQYSNLNDLQYIEKNDLKTIIITNLITNIALQLLLIPIV